MTAKEEELKSALNECKNGNHDLISIHCSGYANDTVEVVRWCRICGCVVVDAENDYRIDPGRIRKMEAPAISKEFVCQKK